MGTGIIISVTATETEAKKLVLINNHPQLIIFQFTFLVVASDIEDLYCNFYAWNLTSDISMKKVIIIHLIFGFNI